MAMQMDDGLVWEKKIGQAAQTFRLQNGSCERYFETLIPVPFEYDSKMIRAHLRR